MPLSPARGTLGAGGTFRRWGLVEMSYYWHVVVVVVVVLFCFLAVKGLVAFSCHVVLL